MLITQLSDISHAFWLVLGAITVLRPAVSSVGRTYGQALAGTVIGLLVSIGVLALDSAAGGTWVLWTALPIATFLWALAPALFATRPFMAGQAAFSLFLVMLFTLLQPLGWRTGLIRLEDVAVGGAVSLVVAVFLWPAGTGSRLRSETAEMLRAATTYLADSLQHAIGDCCYQPTAARMTGDREAAVVSQWKAYTAWEDAQREAGTPRAGDGTTVDGSWSTAFRTAAQLRLAADMIDEIPPPGNTDREWALSVFELADEVVRSGLLLAAVVEDGRPLTPTVDGPAGHQGSMHRSDAATEHWLEHWSHSDDSLEGPLDRVFLHLWLVDLHDRLHQVLEEVQQRQALGPSRGGRRSSTWGTPQAAG